MKFAAILKNKYVLYTVLFFAITTVLGFLQQNDFKSLTTFVIVGVLSTYFSKNMTVNLLVAIIGSIVIRGSGLVREGLKNKKKKKKVSMGESDEEDTTQSADEVAEKLKCKNNKDCDDDFKCSNNQCVSKQDGFGQRNVPSSQPASVDDDDDDESLGKRVDYAATLEQAYDNLEQMLGSDGLKGLTNETKHLVGQQKNLMKTLNNMAPVLNNAKDTLSNLNLPDMGQVKKLMESLQGSKK
jgi:hypothetical protein